jgi:hypothetical protein
MTFCGEAVIESIRNDRILFPLIHGTEACDAKISSPSINKKSRFFACVGIGEFRVFHNL